MTTDPDRHCSGYSSALRAGYSHPCRGAVCVERDGRPYCFQHDPVEMARRRECKRAKDAEPPSLAPWAAVWTGTPACRYVGVRASDGRLVARCARMPDARLCAEGPALLDVCEALIAASVGDDPADGLARVSEVMDMAQAVVARVRGEAQHGGHEA